MIGNLQKVRVIEQNLKCSECNQVIHVGNEAIRKNNKFTGPDYYHRGCRPK